MAQFKINGLRPMTNKSGVTSWYWRPSATLAAAGWEAMPLGKDRGRALELAEQRNAEIAAWRAGGGGPEHVAKRLEAGTLAALIARYRREVMAGACIATGKPNLKPKTIETYETSLKRLEAWAGDRPLSWLTPARVEALRNKLAPPVAMGGVGHAAAFNCLKMLRQLCAFAKLTPNPAAEFKLDAPPPRSQVWEHEDEKAFITAAYDLGLPSMALACELAIYSAQRRSDLIAMTEGQWRPLTIANPTHRASFADEAGQVQGWKLTQGKTTKGKPAVQLEIAFTPDLRRKIETAIAANRARDRAAVPPRLNTHVIVDDRTGLPWTKRAFSSAWSEILAHAATACQRPHMTDLVWHDLRRTRVVRMRRGGMHPAMIAAVTGHSPASIDMMLKVYGPIDATITAAALALAASLEEQAA
jgi:hypothetical protein